MAETYFNKFEDKIILMNDFSLINSPDREIFTLIKNGNILFIDGNYGKVFVDMTNVKNLKVACSYDFTDYNNLRRNWYTTNRSYTCCQLFVECSDFKYITNNSVFYGTSETANQFMSSIKELFPHINYEEIR